MPCTYINPGFILILIFHSERDLGLLEEAKVFFQLISREMIGDNVELYSFSLQVFQACCWSSLDS